jgi:hypothetical protein
MKKGTSILVTTVCFAIPLALSCLPIAFLVKKLMHEWSHINEFTVMVSMGLIIAIVVCGITGLAVGALLFGAFRLILRIRGNSQLKKKTGESQQIGAR